MAKTLLLLRHANAISTDGALPDHERPLDGRGIASAPRVGRWLLEQGLVPDFVIASTARRALETADAVVRASGHAGPLESTPRLYLAPPLGILELLRSLAPTVVRPLVVGHNPGLEQLVYALSGRHERMPTAAAAALELPVADWTELELFTPGRLVTLLRPEEP